MKRLLCLLLISFLLFTSCGNEEENLVTTEEAPIYLSMIEGGQWFLRNQNDEFLHYLYDPITDTYADESHELREMASWWVITELALETDDEELWALADRGYDYFSEYFAYTDAGMILEFEEGNDKLGYNAFAILAMINMDKDEELLNSLADAMIDQQESSGRFNTLFNKTSTISTDYYPGEAMLALMRLYFETEIPEYLDSVSKGFEYYAYDYWPENNNTAFVPWQSQAYYYYYLETQDPLVLDFIFEMNDYMLDRYVQDEACTVFSFPGNVTAVFIEGMNKAYELAVQQEDEERIHCYGKFIIKGVNHVKQLQYPLIDSDPNDISPASVGGYIVNRSKHQMRVDQNQHAIMAMLGAIRLGLVK